MASEVRGRTVPKYKIFVKTLEASPMFVDVEIQVYEIRGCIGRYRRQYHFSTSHNQIKDLDRDLEKIFVEIPEGVRDLSKEEEDEEESVA